MPTSSLIVVLHHQNVMVKNIQPANQPYAKERFQEAVSHDQNSAAAPSGAHQAAPDRGNDSAKRTAASATATASRTRLEESMIRRLGFLISVLALIVSACGRQVTPDRPGTDGSGLPSGYMSVKFRVMQPFNFQTYSYVIVFNTSGDGNTPRANGTQTNYAGYSFAIIVGGTTGTGTATANLYQYYRPPNVTVPQLVPLQPTSNLFIFYPNTNGQGTEFTVTFARSLFYGINNTPGPTSTASATPSPSPSPSVSPSGSPSEQQPHRTAERRSGSNLAFQLLCRVRYRWWSEIAAGRLPWGDSHRRQRHHVCVARARHLDAV